MIISLTLMFNINSTTKLAENFSLLSIAKNAEVPGANHDFKNKIIEKSLFKNLNKTTSYLTQNANKAFIYEKKSFTTTLIF